MNATCKARNFNLIRETAVTVDSQYLKLREAEVRARMFKRHKFGQDGHISVDVINRRLRFVVILLMYLG